MLKRWARGVLLLLLAANALLCLFQAVQRAMEPEWSQDLLPVYRASRLWITGANPYQRYTGAEWTRITGEPPLPPVAIPNSPSTLYPPIALVVLTPISWLHWNQAKLAWLVLNLIFAAIAPIFIWALVKGRLKPELFPIFLLLWLGSQGLRIGLANGQHTLLAITAISAGLLLIRSGRNAAAGVLLGISLFKFPIAAPFFAMLLAKRKFAALVGAGATTLALLAIFFLRLPAPAGEVVRGYGDEWSFWRATSPDPPEVKRIELRSKTDIRLILRIVLRGKRVFGLASQFASLGLLAMLFILWTPREFTGLALSACALFGLWGVQSSIYNLVLLAFVLPVFYEQWRISGSAPLRASLLVLMAFLLTGYIGYANHFEQLLGPAAAYSIDTFFGYALRVAIVAAYIVALCLQWRARHKPLPPAASLS